MRKLITLEQAMKAKPIADPLNLYDCSLISDGAAAVILAPLERAHEFTSKPVRVLGISQASDYVALDQKDDITTFPAVRKAAGKAYSMAGVQASATSSSPSFTIALRSSGDYRDGRFPASSRKARAGRSRSRATRRAMARSR